MSEGADKFPEPRKSPGGVSPSVEANPDLSVDAEHVHDGVLIPTQRDQKDALAGEVALGLSAMLANLSFRLGSGPGEYLPPQE